MSDPNAVTHRKVMIDFDEYAPFHDVIMTEIQVLQNQLGSRILLTHAANITVSIIPPN